MVNQREASRVSARPPRSLTPATASAETDTDTDAVIPEDSFSRVEGLADQQAESEGSEHSLPFEQEYSLPPEHHQDSGKEEDFPPPPSSPLSPPTHSLTFYPAMTETSVTSSLIEAAKIKKLNGPDDWVK